MNIFITSTDTDVGKTYVSRGIVEELLKRGFKTGYFKPLQSGIVPDILSDADNVAQNYNKKGDFKGELVLKNSYVTKTPCTPSVSAEIDGVSISLDKIKEDYTALSKECDITVVEGSGGLFVPVTENELVSDVIKKLDLPVIVVARPDLGTINHILLTLNALRDLKIRILGVVISNFDKNTKDPAVLTAPRLIEKFGNVKILDIIYKNENNFKKIVDAILQ